MSEQQVQEQEEIQPDAPEAEEPDGDGVEVEHDDPPQEQEQPGQPGETEVEKQARERGWVPKDEFKGNPRHWRTAEDYLRRPEDVRRENDDLRDELSAVKRLVQTVKKDAESLKQQGYERAMEEIAAQQFRAAEEGDTDKWQQLEEQRRKIAPPASEPREDEQQGPGPELREWLGENPWFQNDEALNLEARGIEKRLLQQHPHMPDRERLNRITEEVKRRNPELFGLQPQEQKPNYRRPQKVAGQEARGGNSSSPPGKGWADIPDADRAVARQYGHVGGKNPIYKTEADYAKAYWREHG